MKPIKSQTPSTKLLTPEALELIKNTIGLGTRPAKGLFEGWMKPDDPDSGKTFVLGGVKPSRSSASMSGNWNPPMEAEDDSDPKK